MGQPAPNCEPTGGHSGVEDAIELPNTAVPIADQIPSLLAPLDAAGGAKTRLAIEQIEGDDESFAPMRAITAINLRN